MTKVTLDLHPSAGAGGPTPPPHQDLYAKRRQIYPKLAHGKFRMVKWAVMAIALAVYYAVPWIRWDRGEGIPNQAVIADFGSEKFYFFFIEIWPQDIHYLAGLLILASMALFLVTALLGRVWCGYACPQTVWTDLYIWVERAFEGDRAARIRLDKAPLSANKLTRKLGKHIVWLVIAFWTGGAFILYWHDAPTIARGWFTGEAPLSAYWFAGILTLTTYFLAGFMREQVCTYMCPWPRIQAALTDEHALNVTYRYDRGEPRGPKRKSESWDERGECIDCDQCVQVCPVGIDIRNGSQLECIHCALCIDACDAVMDKIGKPRGLVSYATFANRANSVKGVASPSAWQSFIRPRTYVYIVGFSAICLAMLVTLLMRDRLDVSVLHDRNPQFVKLSDGSIRNGFTVKILNMIPQPRTFILSIKGIKGATMEIAGSDKVAAGFIEVKVAPDKLRALKVYVTADRKNLASAQNPLQIFVEDTQGSEAAEYSAIFEGPKK